MNGSTFGDLSRYAILGRHAVGGAAELYRARDQRTDQVVMIKRMRPDLEFDPTVGAGFEREIQIAMMSDHKNLVRGLDKGMHQGLDWVVFQFIDGMDLAQVLHHSQNIDTPIPREIGLYLIIEILEGLAFAQAMKDPMGFPMGLVHRDLNPRNILIGWDGGVHLADFGCALASATEPEPEEVVGSAGYLSPEQARLSLLDPRSDIFSIGCIFYEIAVNEPAFWTEGIPDEELLQMHREGEIRDVPETVSGFVERVILKACAPDREKRFADAQSMLDAIENLRPPRSLEDLKSAFSAWLHSAFERR